MSMERKITKQNHFVCVISTVALMSAETVFMICVSTELDRDLRPSLAFN